MDEISLRSLGRREIWRLAGQYAGEGRPLSLLSDFGFKAVFAADTGDSREALRRLLSACIHRPVSAIHVVNNELVPEYRSGKTALLDIHAAFNDGEEADIEMQMKRGGGGIRARSAFLAARLLSGQARKGQEYHEIRRVYQIFFLNFELFSGSGKVPRRYVMMEEEEHDRLSSLMEILFYELPKAAKALISGKNGLSDEEKWCIYLKYRGEEGMSGVIEGLCKEEEGIMTAERTLRRVSREKEKWARALFREKAEMDYYSEMRASREMGRGEAEERAYREKLESARRFAGMGLASAKIADGLGITPEEAERALKINP
jgi:predicted transposase/invertase (TIGR01784 family)